MSEQNIRPEVEVPDDALKEVFRTTIIGAGIGKQVDPCISIFMDSEAFYSVTFEETVEGNGEPRATYHGYDLYVDGRLEKRTEQGPLGNNTISTSELLEVIDKIRANFTI